MVQRAGVEQSIEACLDKVIILKLASPLANGNTVEINGLLALQALDPYLRGIVLAPQSS